ncbi:MAG: phosphatidate cytidylyltransferase [Hyphomicrobium sp.]
MKISRVKTQGTGKQDNTNLTELQRRIFSGFILIGILLFFTLYSNTTFSILVCVTSLIVSWEWSRIVYKNTLNPLLFVQGICVFTCLLLSSRGYHLEALMILIFGLIFLILLSWTNLPLLPSLGILYAGLPGVTLLWIKQDHSYGLYAILYIFFVVIGTDTASYIIGRRLGGKKLAPKISPNKTWSGFLGGISVPSLISIAFIVLKQSSISLFFTTVILALLCQLGDLAESFLKRKFQIKDSSNLIPGHGGILDRVDGLIFASLGAGLMSLIINPTFPAKALLFWSFSS